MDLRILDLDGSLTVQPSLCNRWPPVVSCQRWGPRLRLACSFSRFRRFEACLTTRLGSSVDVAPPLTFVGSGDFHHVSLALLRRLPEPFNLLVIDNHPDWMRRIPVLHCGTWLWHASHLPNVCRIFHVGGDVDFDNSFHWLAPWQALKDKQITVMPALRSYRRGQWTRIPHTPLRGNRDEQLTADRLNKILEPFSEDLAGRPLYISLDKDVMSTTHAIVNWDSGHLDFGEVRTILGGFIRAAEGKMAGMDVVGDWSPVQVRGLLRRFLHFTEHPHLEVTPHEALTVNDRTNQAILDTLAGLGVYGTTSRRAAS